MNYTRINFTHFSEAFWKQVEYVTRDKLEHQAISIMNTWALCGDYAKDADYKTGSINLSAMHTLAALSLYYQPMVTIEIGTFIGRSACMLATYGKVYTCDKDNDCFPGSDHIQCFGKTNSTDMLKQLKDPADLFFFDGRIQDADLEHIYRLSNPRTVYAFDDFEGVEKGVANVIKLSRVFDNYILIAPQNGIALMINPASITLDKQ